MKAVAAKAALVLAVVLAVAAAGTSWRLGRTLLHRRAVEEGLNRVFEAEWEYHSKDSDGDGYLEFAGDVSELGLEGRLAGDVEWRIFPVPWERFGPDGGLLSGFLAAAVPKDGSGEALVRDHLGRRFEVPADRLEEWVREYVPEDGGGGG